ncbi:nuclear valosin-containing protein-like [Copidosoma floridanum]|uniref:nuclear valosin-containing protein-like n=1 Tax=Copidosoma floridanum TaxID=29053 RepID=UPI0006C9DBBE|nr:nuclear valosin-containing protein-like [Copidosoma floridanum]
MTPNLDMPPATDIDHSDPEHDSEDDAAAKREKELITRVEAYLYENQDEDTVDIEKLTTYLRRKYKNYRNKNSRPTFSMVSRAFEIVTEKLNEQNRTLCEDFSEIDVENVDESFLKSQKKSNKDDAEVLVNDLSCIPSSEKNGINVSHAALDGSLLYKTHQTKNNNADESQTFRKPQKLSKKRDNDSGVPPSLLKKKTKEFPVINSTNTFHDVGGNEQLVMKIVKKIKHIKHPEIIDKFKQKSPPRGFLLCGPPGCGKSLLARAIAGQLNIPLLEVAATDLVAGVTGESEENLRDLFDQAIAIAPCVLFLDKIDTLATNRENAQKGMEKRIVHQLCACLDKLSQSESKDKVLVVGTTDQLDSLDQSLRTPGRFEEEFCLSIPNKEARTSILKILTKGVKLAPEVNLEKIAQMTPGYVASELDKLINEAEDKALERVLHDDFDKSIDWETDLNESLTVDQLMKLKVKEQDFEAALKVVKPSAKKDEGFVSVPNVSWDDIGSLQDIREELQLDILAPVKYPEMYDEDSELETGVLLCGPPGCGKTLLAKAMANEAGINFISVKGPEFLNKFVGESEKNVRKCFARARNAAPCIIFFDELDALCPKRSEIDGNATSRVVNAMLTELDGVCNRKDVFVMAASNRPEIIDPALLRSGRFDKILYVGLPKARDRYHILSALTKGSSHYLLAQINLRSIADDVRCEGFSGADLKGLVKQARREYVRDKISGKIRSSIIQSRHFERALKKIKPTVKRKHMKRYEKLEKMYSIERMEEKKQRHEEPKQVVVKKEKIDRRDNIVKTKKTEKCDSGVEVIDFTVDQVLMARVKKYAEKMKQKPGVTITVTDTANHLKRDYKEYRHVDYDTVFESVRDVFDIMVGKSPYEIQKSKENSGRQTPVKSRQENRPRSSLKRSHSDTNINSTNSSPAKKSSKKLKVSPTSESRKHISSKSSKKKIHVEAGCCT